MRKLLRSAYSLPRERGYTKSPLKPVKTLKLEGLSKQILSETFLDVSHRYTNLFDSILKRSLEELPESVGGTKLTRSSDRAYYIRAEPLRHPLIFYLAHTSCVYINKLLVAGLIKDDERVDKWLEGRSSVGVDEMAWDDKLLDLEHVSDGPSTDPQSETMAWPTVRRVFDFRKKTEERMLKTIESLDLSKYNPNIAHKHPVWSILMGIEHENIHLETSCPIIRQLPLECVNKVEELKIAPPKHRLGLVDLDKWVDIKEKEVKMGSEWSGVPESYKSVTTGKYSWDNENGSHVADVKDFSMRQFLTTNGEYRVFVESGAYKNPKYWPEEGKQWPVNFSHPRWWIKTDDGWDLRLIDRIVPLPEMWPVETNHHESVAYLNWYNEKHGTNYRLPTEEEHYLAMETPSPLKHKEAVKHANVDLRHYHSSNPVDMFCHPSGVFDLQGNVWNWTCTNLYPFKHFTVHGYYDDFTLPTFDSRHAILKGGSWISCGNLSLPWSRYAFRRHFYQFAGFRMIKGEKAEEHESNPYEEDKLVCGYIQFHYYDVMNELKVPNFCLSIAKEVFSVLSKNGVSMDTLNKWRALDLGCGPGRLTYELARNMQFGLGIDYSVRFIQVAHQYRDTGKVAFKLQSEGEIYTDHLVEFDTSRLQNTHFIQCDAHNLPRVSVDADGKALDCSHWEVIVCANLIDRLRKPRDVLRHLSSCQKSGNWLFLLSPYTWMEDWTEKSEWIGGYIGKDGKPVKTHDGLQSVLSDYELVHATEIPFLLQEHARKSQYSKSHFTAWRKK